MQLLRQSPQRRPRNRGHWPLKMTLDISPVLVEKVIFHNPITRTVLPRLSLFCIRYGTSLSRCLFMPCCN
jgi:hypothetical protein